MSQLKNIKKKIYAIDQLKLQVDSWRETKQKIVFTNGCFDVIHKGHIECLVKASELGEKLIVGLNSDYSIKQLKGIGRPILDEETRVLLLASLSFIYAVVIFDQETPYNLINEMLPDILVKGGDYKIVEVIGHDIVQEYGGKIVLIPLVEGISSTNIIKKIKDS